MYKIKILKNKTKIIYKKVNYLNSINLGIFIKCGSLNETKENNGLSHLLEHMLFKRTQKNTAKDIALATDKIGADINAYTTPYYTCIYMKALSIHAYKGMDILFDMINCPAYSKEDLETEKQVIFDEIDSSQDDPDDQVEKELTDLLMKDNSYKYNVLGSKNTIEEISLEDLMEYRDINYVGANMVISVVGNIDEDNLIAYIERNFDEVDEGQEKINPIPEIIPSKNKLKIVNRNLDQLTAYININSLIDLEIHKYSLSLLNNILGGSISSKLFQSIREDKGLTYNINSFTYDNNIEANINIYYTCNSSNLIEISRSILEELNMFSSYKISQEDLNISKSQLSSEILLNLEDPYEEMIAMGEELLLKNKIYDTNKILKKINDLSIYDIRDLKDDIFLNYSYNIIYVGDVEEDNISSIKNSLLLE